MSGCAWPAGCDYRPKYMDPRTGKRYCGVHARLLANPGRGGAAADVVKALQASGAKADLSEDPAVFRAQGDLAAHEAGCARCAAVRVQTVREGEAGLIKTPEDVNRVGRRIIEDCCPAGVELNRKVGLAMHGLPTSEPAGRAEYDERVARNTVVEGEGLDVATRMPCPFCGAPDFVVTRILEAEEVMAQVHGCAACERAGTWLIERDGDSLKAEFVQVAGPPPPAWLDPPPRRVP